MYLAPSRRDHALRIFLEIRGPILADATAQAGKSVLKWLSSYARRCTIVDLLSSWNLLEVSLLQTRNVLFSQTSKNQRMNSSGVPILLGPTGWEEVNMTSTLRTQSLVG